MKISKIIIIIISIITTLFYLNLHAHVKNNSSLNIDWLDKTIFPENDFYHFANGNWQLHHPIPAEYPRWGLLTQMDKHNQKRLLEIIKESAKNATPDSIEQKVSDFFISGMNEKKIEAENLSPLSSEFNLINQIKNKIDLQTEFAHLQSLGLGGVFYFTSTQDYINSKKMIGASFQDGIIGLPNRDYYLNNDSETKKIREHYFNHIIAMLKLYGENISDATTDAKNILALETSFAANSLSNADLREPKNTYHVMDRNQLKKLTPQFDWEYFFKSIHHDEIQSINIATLAYFKNFNNLLKTIPLSTWKSYLRWQLLHNTANYLSDKFVQENFKLTTVLSGVKNLLPRWQRVLKSENDKLDFALGELFVKHYFSENYKQQVTAIVDSIHLEFERDIQSLKWMSKQTRAKALQKLSLMKSRIAYPNHWRDYSSLNINKDSYVLNVLRANEFLFKRTLNKIDKPIDNDDRQMSPQEVNAFYDVSQNTLTIPAGILQSPIFDPKAPAAINYGGVGAIIGHEMTHAFDDIGAQFDGYGNLENWWQKSDAEKFQHATACLANYFSTFTINKTLHLQGKLIIGEATADLGGVKLAYYAFINSPFYKTSNIIYKFTPEQQFFIAFAHLWTANIRPEKIRDLVLSDPHPINQFRVNGTLANLSEFKQAFNISDSSKMINKKRCEIW